MDRVCPMLLRTHYAENEDGKKRHDKMMEEWIDVNQFYEEAWWAVLDDVDLFDFGSEWRRIYDVLPEIAYLGALFISGRLKRAIRISYGIIMLSHRNTWRCGCISKEVSQLRNEMTLKLGVTIATR
jgi:hypothetical protein